MEELAEHGVFLPPNMQGLTDEQIEELKLRDEWGEKCVPSGGAVFKKDDVGRRNGHGNGAFRSARLTPGRALGQERSSAFPTKPGVSHWPALGCGVKTAPVSLLLQLAFILFS